MYRCCLLALLLLLSVGGTAWGEDAYSPGFRDVTYRDDARNRVLPTAIWYPSDATAEKILYAQIHNGHAAPDASIAPGRHPLVVLSHGTNGNRFNQYFLGEALAAAGYIVAAIEHPGDRTFDNGDFGTSKNLYNRPRDITFAIDALLSDETIAPHIDQTRIAAMGHSAGGFAAVTAAGGRPDLDLLLLYCAAQSDQTLTCPDSSTRDARELPLHADYIHGLVSLRDARLGALVLFAPAIGPMFDALALEDITVPTILFWAEQDEILDEPANSENYHAGLKSGEMRAMTGFGHFTFLSVCSDLLRRYAPQICRDPDGTDRGDVTAMLATDVIVFLDRHLGQD